MVGTIRTHKLLCTLRVVSVEGTQSMSGQNYGPGTGWFGRISVRKKSALRCSDLAGEENNAILQGRRSVW